MKQLKRLKNNLYNCFVIFVLLVSAYLVQIIIAAFAIAAVVLTWWFW